MRSLGGFAFSALYAAESWLIAAADERFPCLIRTEFLKQGIKLELEGILLLFQINLPRYILY